MKLVHWPLLHLVQRGGDWAGLYNDPLLCSFNVIS